MDGLGWPPPFSHHHLAHLAHPRYLRRPSAAPRSSNRRRQVALSPSPPYPARHVPLVHARIARERCWIRRRPAGNCPLELLRACTPRLGACERGDSRVSEELRLTARAHVQTRPRACPIAGRTPSGAGNTIWRQADAASGRAVDCPTILRAIFFCGHLSLPLIFCQFRRERCICSKSLKALPETRQIHRAIASDHSHAVV